MEKIFFAINHPKFEELIEGGCREFAKVCCTTFYQEGILSQLESSNATVLILQEALAGQYEIEDLIKKLRIEHGTVRIILIAGKKEKDDPLISLAVSLGIYDIACADAVSYLDIVDMVRNPRTLSDCSSLCSFADSPVFSASASSGTSEKQKEKKSRFGLFSKREKEKNEAVSSEPHENIDIEKLRESIRIEAERNAERNAEKIIEWTYVNTLDTKS